MKIKRCDKCGRDNEFESDICGHCGADITAVKITETTFKKISQQAFKEMFAIGARSKKLDSPSLAICPDCGKRISVKARVCPGCGRPTDEALEEDKTAKRNKRGNVQGMGCLLIVISIFSVFFLPFLGVPLFIIGFVILIVGLFI